MSLTEECNIAAAQTWVTLWNSDVDRLVDECYAADCVCVNKTTSEIHRGREELRLAEHKMVAVAPDHRMEVSRMLPSGDSVVVEAVCHGLTPEPLPMCVVLTFDDGLIVTDHTYAGYFIPAAP